MIFYCYFIARSQPEIENPPYRTLDAAPLWFVRHGDLIAAVRRLPAGTRSTPELMLEYNGVLAAASKRGTVLPLRFGTSFRTEAAVVRLLAGRRTELSEALERLEDKVEMALRLSLPGPDAAREKAAQMAEIGRPLDSWFEVRSNPAGETILEVAHLIDRQEAAGYRQRLKSHAREVWGPRPPLHFLPQFLRMPVQAERGAGRARRGSAERAG